LNKLKLKDDVWDTSASVELMKYEKVIDTVEKHDSQKICGLRVVALSFIIDEIQFRLSGINKTLIKIPTGLRHRLKSFRNPLWDEKMNTELCILRILKFDKLCDFQNMTWRNAALASCHLIQRRNFVISYNVKMRACSFDGIRQLQNVLQDGFVVYRTKVLFSITESYPVVSVKAALTALFNKVENKSIFTEYIVRYNDIRDGVFSKFIMMQNYVPVCTYEFLTFYDFTYEKVPQLLFYRTQADVRKERSERKPQKSYPMLEGGNVSLSCEAPSQFDEPGNT
jgi:hypothetical protein